MLGPDTAVTELTRLDFSQGDGTACIGVELLELVGCSRHACDYARGVDGALTVNQTASPSSGSSTSQVKTLVTARDSLKQRRASGDNTSSEAEWMLKHAS